MYIYIIFSLFIHQFLSISAISSLVIVKRAAINMSMQVNLLYIDLHSFGYKHKSDMAGS
jgi:hypothetical protein